MAAGTPQPAGTDERPGPTLAITLGLIVMAFLLLPSVGGGYSGLGYQVAFVLLPVAAAIAWGTASERPRLAVIVALLYTLSGLAMPFFIQQGRLLWFDMLAIPTAWIVTWVALREVPHRAKYLPMVLCGGAAISALYGWFLWLGAGTLDYPLTGTFGLKNAFAGYLLLAWPYALFTMLRAENSRLRAIYGVLSAFLAITLVLTYSRAAWIAFAIQLGALGIYLLWRRFVQGRQLDRAVLATGGGVVALLCLLPAIPLVREVAGRVFSFSGYSMQGRIRFWSAALEIFRDHPLLGVGPGNFAYVYPQYQQDYIYYSVDPHSWPLQLLCELGLVGLAVLVAIVTGLFLWARKLWRTTDGSLPAAVLIIALLGSLLHAAVDFDYTFTATTMLLGVILAYGAHISNPASAGPAPGTQRWLRLASGATMVLLFAVAAIGEVLTTERFSLDKLMELPATSIGQRSLILKEAITYNRFNHRTQFQQASILAQVAQAERNEEYRAEAEKHLDTCLRLNPRYAQAWALKALISRDKDKRGEYIEQALNLDKYNFPDHYFTYATLAPNDAEKRERMLLGLKRIPVVEPITPEHVRPTWFELNPLWVQWYYELAKLTEDEDEAASYRRRAANFDAYWRQVQKDRTPGEPSADGA